MAAETTDPGRLAARVAALIDVAKSAADELDRAGRYAAADTVRAMAVAALATPPAPISRAEAHRRHLLATHPFFATPPAVPGVDVPLGEQFGWTEAHRRQRAAHSQPYRGERAPGCVCDELLSECRPCYEARTAAERAAPAPDGAA